MDVLKDMAWRFCRSLETHARTLDIFDGELNSKLIYINKISEKLRFLSYLKDFVETKYHNHAEKCTDPETCHENRACEIALYSIKQQYDDYYASIGGVNTSERPAMQYFTQGQYFDAFTSIREKLKEAKKSVVLIDGYVDADTLSLFPGKEPGIELLIVTKKKSINDAFKRAIELYNKQYEKLFVLTSEDYHDRFLIIDDMIFYHIGASIKDAGNKDFMYSRIEDEDIKNLIRLKVSTIAKST